MNALKVIGAVIVGAAVLSAVFVLWTMRHRADRFARSTRYNMLGTITLCAILPARLVEERLAVIPWFLLLIALLGGGVFFLWKARSTEG